VVAPVKNPTDTFPRGKPASNKDHWLVFSLMTGPGESDVAEAHDTMREAVSGCHCGFPASTTDEGYGDSVVDHLIDVGITWEKFRAARDRRPE
jgi:hypothetical protein